MRIVIRSLSLCMMVLSVSLLIGRWHLYQKEDQDMNAVVQLLEQCIRPESVSMNEEYEKDDIRGVVINERDHIDIDKLRTMNPDVAAVLRIDGTKIDYPVMCAERADYYMDHDFYGKKSVYGSIFLAASACDTSCNRIMYGHHMKNGAMFGVLEHYMNRDYQEEHRWIKYICKDTVDLYEVIVAFTAEAEESGLMQNLSLSGIEQTEWMTNFIKRSQGMIYGEFQSGSEYLTLVTCEYAHKDGRLFVIGKKVKEE